MTRKRHTTEEERALFEGAVKKAMLLLPTESMPKRTAKKMAAQPSLQGGLDGRTAERLRRGLIEPDARLDLHGLTEDGAHRALERFLRTAHAGNGKLVLVVTGKGARPDDAPFDLGRAPRGILKSLVPRWLEEPALAPYVAATVPAHRRHGGDGALYVYLRRKRARP